MQVSIKLASPVLQAAYEIEQTDAISYQARLVFFQGHKPPSYIRLYKTEIGWSSAFEDQALVQEIGAGIDKALQGIFLKLGFE